MVSVCKFAVHLFRLSCSALSWLQFWGCHLHFISTSLLVFINLYDCLFVLMHKQVEFLCVEFWVTLLCFLFYFEGLPIVSLASRYTPPAALLPPTLITLITNTCSSFTCPSICPQGLGSFYKRSSWTSSPVRACDSSFRPSPSLLLRDFEPIILKVEQRHSVASKTKIWDDESSPVRCSVPCGRLPPSQSWS